MQYEIEDVEQVTVITVKGRLVGQPGGWDFVDAFQEMRDRGRRQVVVDMEYVTSMDAGGLGALVAGVALIRNAGGDVRLASVPQAIQSLLMITRVRGAFESFHTVGEAAASYEPAL